MMMSGGYFELSDGGGAGKKVFAEPEVFRHTGDGRRCGAPAREARITFATVHGNRGIMEAAARAKGKVKILAVTVATSLDKHDIDELGHAGTCRSSSSPARAGPSRLRLRRCHRLGTRAARAAQGRGSPVAHRDAGHPAGGEPARGRPETRGYGRAGVSRRGRPYRRRPPDPRCGGPRKAAEAIQTTIAATFAG